jgi:hypothetical protein
MLLPGFYASAVCKLAEILGDDVTELTTKNGTQWRKPLRQIVVTAFPPNERTILRTKVPRNRCGKALTEVALRQREHKRTIQAKVGHAMQKVKRMFNSSRNPSEPARQDFDS